MWVTPTEAAKMAAWPKRDIHRGVEAGAIRAKRLSRRKMLIDWTDTARWVLARRSRPTA